jgi:hypothetical protein
MKFTQGNLLEARVEALVNTVIREKQMQSIAK